MTNKHYRVKGFCGSFDFDIVKDFYITVTKKNVDSLKN